MFVMFKEVVKTSLKYYFLLFPIIPNKLSTLKKICQPKKCKKAVGASMLRISFVIITAVRLYSGLIKWRQL